MNVSSLSHGFPGLGRIATFLPALVLLAGCGHGATKPPKPPVEVTITTPVKGEVQDYEDFTGRLDAFRTVDIRARVTGYLNSALGDDTKLVKEGDLVRKGEVLFYIDPRSYQADLDQAEANLKLALAERNLQELISVRARQMYASRSIGKEEYDTVLATREKSAASVGSMTAAHRRATIFLNYTEVKAPLSGRISRRNVDPGNLIKADDTLLTTIVADDKVYAYFDVDERTYLAIAGEKYSSSPSHRVTGLKSPVLMKLANEEEFKRRGDVDFLDNRLNGNTGTIRLRGIFDNAEGLLKSGLFVRIRLPVGTRYETDLIPDEALQSDQGKKFVYVVGSEETSADSNERLGRVEYRAVRIGHAIKGLRVIKEPRFGLTTDALKALRTDGVPEAVVSRLENLKDQNLEPEKKFLEGLTRALPPDELQKFKKELLARGFREGLKSHEKVMISGMQRVRPKDRVKLDESPQPPRPEFPLGKLLGSNQTKSEEGPKPPREGAELPAQRPAGGKQHRGK